MPPSNKKSVRYAKVPGQDDELEMADMSGMKSIKKSNKAEFTTAEEIGATADNLLSA